MGGTTTTGGFGGQERLANQSETSRRRTNELLNPEKSKRRSKLWLMTGGAATATAFQVGTMFSNPLVLSAAGAAAAAGVLGYFASRKG